MASISASEDGATVAGTVLLDDGLPPSEPIAVALLCEGSVVSETEADPDGRFQLPASPGEGCIVRVSHTGYRVDSMAVGELPEDPEVGALVLHRLGKAQGETISVTWLAAPKKARKAFHAAIREMRRGPEGDLATAIEALETAVVEYPGYAAAWHDLGALRMSTGDAAGAREAWKRSIDADPWYVTPYEPLLMLSLAEEKWDEARQLCDQMLVMNPYLANTHYYRGLASLQLGEVDEARKAVKAIEEGLEAETFTQLHHLRGLIFEETGDIKAAAAEYWRYLEVEPEGEQAGSLRRRLGEWMADGKIEASP
jgi:tetratricopeptide (TPR) repeat protein